MTSFYFEDLFERYAAEIDDLSSDSEGRDEWEERNRIFHEVLIAACPSRWIKHFIGILYHQAERYRRVSLSHSQGRRFVHDEHVAIFEAAVARNAMRACRLTEDHLMRTYDAVRGALERMQAEAADAA